MSLDPQAVIFGNNSFALEALEAEESRRQERLEMIRLFIEADSAETALEGLRASELRENECESVREGLIKRVLSAECLRDLRRKALAECESSARHTIGEMEASIIRKEFPINTWPLLVASQVCHSGESKDFLQTYWIEVLGDLGRQVASADPALADNVWAPRFQELISNMPRGDLSKVSRSFLFMLLPHMQFQGDDYLAYFKRVLLDSKCFGFYTEWENRDLDGFIYQMVIGNTTKSRLYEPIFADMVWEQKQRSANDVLSWEEITCAANAAFLHWIHSFIYHTLGDPEHRWASSSGICVDYPLNSKRLVQGYLGTRFNPSKSYFNRRRSSKKTWENWLRAVLAAYHETKPGRFRRFRLRRNLARVLREGSDLLT